jgi:hypothetical protein
MSKFRSLSLATLLLSGIALQSSAQDFTDVLRYSNLSPTGTARSMGFGNALGSIGGDFTSLSVNPAGIGIYRSSELVFTPSLKVNSTSGQYLNNTTNDNNTRFNFNSAGLVVTAAAKGKRYERAKWKSVSFAFGVNRLADYNRDYTYGGKNTTTSATQAYASDATINGTSNTPGSLGYLGYQSYLTNYDSINNKFTSIIDPTKGINQLRRVEERGGLNEIVLTLGGNYMEKLMLGATLGIPIINYNRTATYSESTADASTDFQGYTASDNLTTNGAGVNLKLGAIYKISQTFRIGAAVHTPTYYSMHDQYTTYISSDITSVGHTYVPANTSVFDYSMTTPWRGVLSASAIIGKIGFITADYEYVNYPSASFRFGADYADAENTANQGIKDELQAASNVRVGLEARVTNFFSLRAGFGYNGNPYKDNSVDGSSMSFSGGFGFRFDHWFLDAAFMHTQFKNADQPYPSFDPTIGVPIATLQTDVNNAALTVGFKF